MRWNYLGLKWLAMGWLVLGRQGEALTVFDRLLERWPDDAYGLASRAHLRAQAGQLTLALEDHDHWVQVDPENPQAWFNRGFLLESLERYEDALASFVRATDLAPKLDRAWYGQGLVLIRLRRYDEAVRALKRNTELQPMSPYGWYQLARVHVDRRDPDEAVKIIRHLKGFEPKVAAQLERETGLLAGAPTS
jgi:tetratricopeptide (TPR) repeat protein